ncbi:hypothetical protein WH50_11915 [Pokkaliibacter plantistimulans]|uniref:Uncharacterized protein n=1 Tax=Pokkaliibacter plantistimulans TaxID=1635171 RepID=A0ABX5LXZ3_9GAMM|nr:hypothetical protein [Pokkaliibacter plantistimulans]PXF31067.1 hypothetical protein WH50_11915 [Pokkaliibacter plantistimulans]
MPKTLVKLDIDDTMLGELKAMFSQKTASKACCLALEDYQRIRARIQQLIKENSELKQDLAHHQRLLRNIKDAVKEATSFTNR